MNNEPMFIGHTPAAVKLQKFVDKASKSFSNILLYGPSGSGKLTIATMLHERSGAKGAFLVLNPRVTQESDIRLALERPNPKNATLVVQNVEDFSFLQQNLINKFTSLASRGAATRLIVLATTDPERLFRDGKLMESLYEALKEFDHVEVPGLNKRAEDIPLLVDYFVRNACKGLNMKSKVIDINSLEFLIKREWKENIRELKYVMEQAVASSPGDILELPRHIIDEFAQLEGMVMNIREKKSFSFDKSLSNLEKTLIEKALDVVGNNQRKAAAVLDVSESNLRYRLKKFKILSTRQK